MSKHPKRPYCLAWICGDGILGIEGTFATREAAEAAKARLDAQGESEPGYTRRILKRKDRATKVKAVAEGRQA